MKNSVKQGLILEYSTLVWNAVGSIIVISLAIKAVSVSLFGFGIDSIIEIFASVVVIWQLKSINKNGRKLATQLIGISFMLLSSYILIQAIIELLDSNHSHPSPFCMLWLFVTAIVMFVLAYRKKKVGTALQNPVLLAEAKVTIIDGLLAVSVLIGLLLNAYLGWWWADIAASLVIVFYGIREAVHLFQ
jgi:divalent metal cation (Fe/Co/Zn/Cd) transporter